MPSLKVTMVANDHPPTPAWVLDQLTEQGIDLREQACVNEADVLEAATDAEVVWLFGGSRVVTAAVLPKLKKCRVILRSGTGTDNVPVAEATRLGILVANTPETTTHTVAEHAIGLLLAVLRQIAVHDRLVRQGVWDRERAWPNWHIVGQTLGLVGFGRIARAVARKMAGFEVKIIAADPVCDAGTMAQQGVEKVELPDLLQRADFVSIHTPLLDDTYHLIGERELRLMKSTAVLINTARGKVIDEKALIRALQEKWIAAAGLDVLETQPPAPDNPLLQLDNVVLTPHIAGYSDEFWDTFWSHSIRTLAEIAKGRPPLWVVNPQAASRREETGR